MPPRPSPRSRPTAATSPSTRAPTGLSTVDNNAVQNVFVHTQLLAPPVNYGQPKLSGQPISGQSLGCSDGIWSEGAITRQWRRDEVAIPGATAASYALSGADVGTLIDCLVTATNADGSASTASNAVLVSEPLQGPAGAQGPQGTAGPPGPQGPAGADGQDREPAIKLLPLLSSNKFRAAAGKKLKVRFATSGAGTLKAVLKGTKGKAKKVTVRKKASVKKAGTFKLAMKLRAKKRSIPKGPYRLTLRLKGSDGQTARDTAAVRVR